MRIAVALSFLLLAANSLPTAPQPRQQTENAAAARTTTSAPSNAIRSEGPPGYTAPCGPGEERRNSDLCAQWKAADAASESSRLNWWQLLVGTIGGAGLILALGLTAWSNRIAGRALKVAQETAKRELRAYVYVATSGHLFQETDDPITDIRYRNSGQSPAYNLRGEHRVSVGPSNKPPRPPRLRDLNRKTDILGPGCEGMSLKHYIDVVPGKDMEPLRKGAVTLWLTGAITYEDIYGQRWLYRYIKHSREPYYRGLISNHFAHERQLLGRPRKLTRWYRRVWRKKRKA